MKISLITICYDSGEYLKTAIESVLSQSYPDLEYIIIDGGSTDGTVDLVKSYGNKIDVFISERDEGIYDAMNKGIQTATGDIVGTLNADDFLRHDRVLEEVANSFDDNIDAIYADIRFVKGENLDEVTRYYSAKKWRPWMLRWGFMPPHPSFYCRRNFFDELGVYKTDYKIAADYELLIRFLYKARLRTVYINDALVDMRLGGVSTAGISSTITLNREIVRANRENGIYTNMPMLMMKYPFKVWELLLNK